MVNKYLGISLESVLFTRGGWQWILFEWSFASSGRLFDGKALKSILLKGSENGHRKHTQRSTQKKDGDEVIYNTQHLSLSTDR